MGLFVALALITAAILPSLIWLIFFMREDVHPEPKRIIIFTIGIGVLAALPTIFAQVLFRDSVGNADPLFIFFGLALIEEVFKFFAAFYAVRKTPFLDEPIDAMIYMIAAATGFSTIENVLFAIGFIESFTLPALYDASSLLLLRFIGATLLHVLASGIVGYYWAKAILKEKHPAGLIFYGLVIATVVHTAFNYLIAFTNEQNLVYSSIILIVAAFFVLNDFEILKKKPAFVTHPTETA